MKNIYIVGGNGFARECYAYLKELEKENKDIKFAGFLGHGGYGDNVDYKDMQEFYKGDVSNHKFLDDEYVIIGAGSSELRSMIYHDLKAMNVKFYTLITVGASLNEFVELGEANIFNKTTITSPQIKIGNGNLFNDEIIVGHDVEIGDFNFFAPRTQLLGYVKIGNKNMIGANTILLPKSKIGDNNKIAPLSAIYKGCKNNCYMQGNPALKIGDVD